MMDVRELVTKFSFQVNSEAVTKFISLLAKAETSLDNLGNKTVVNAGKARVEGEKRTQRQIEAIQRKWDKRRNDRLKLAVKEQQKADKQQLDYEERRSKVLSARDLSRIKRRIKAEETANKLIAKQQVEANKIAKKQQADYEKRRASVLSKLEASREGRRLQKSNLLRRASQEDSKGFQELLFFKGFSNKYDNKTTSNPVIPAGATSIPQKSLNDFVNNLFGSITESMKKQKVVEKSVKKRTDAEIKDIQKRWDDRRRKRYTEEQRYQQWLQRGSIGEKARMAGMFPSIKINRTGSEDLVGFAKKTRLSLKQPAPTGGGGGGGGGFSLADTYFNVQLLKDAYQLFYNIAEATRQTAVNILRTNDALNMSIAKIGVITGDTKNASKNFKELLDISAQTGSEIGVIEEIFNRLSMGKEGLGATTEQIIDFTSAIAKMSAFSEGGPAQQGALRQLGQMFGGAYIQAQEWNSIVDGLPAVASKIAKAMGTTREAMTFKIRQQTKDSPAYLISDIFPKLLKILPEIEAEFKKLPPTLDRTLNKAGVGLLKFSLNLKESVKMPELDAFYSRLDGTIQKIFEWANANKTLIGTNINSFFKTLGDVLSSVDMQLKDTTGTAQILNNVFYILNGTVKFLKATFDALLWTLQAIKPLMQWIQEHPTSTNVIVGAGGGAIIGGRVAGPVGASVGAAVGGLAGFIKGQNDKAQPMINKIDKYNAEKNLRRLQKLKQGKSIDQINKEEIAFYHNFGRNPQAGFGTKGGGVTVVQNNNFNGNSATPSQQKETAKMVHPALGNAVSTALNKRSISK